MPHSICLIDDSIPLGENLFIDDRGRLNSSNIELLLNQEDINWDEDSIKELLTDLINDKKTWTVSAFRTPDIFLNNFDKENYLPDFIIFDWDYSGTTESSDMLLKKIMEKSFSLISIYTRSGEEETVNSIIESNFKEYQNRITVIIKSDENSPQKLIDIANKSLDDNFSFKFSKELRNHNLESLETILIEFAKPSLKDIVWLFGDEDEQKNRLLHPKELIEIIVEKLRNELISKNFGPELPIIPNNYSSSAETELVKKMWSYRLYYNPKDDIVRKGDVIKRNDTDDKILFLVISSDCHMKKFWKSNFGYLMLAPIHEIHKSNSSLINKIDFYKKKSELKSSNDKSTSLTNTSLIGEGPTIIPCIPLNEALKDYILFPKEMFSVEISIPESKKDTKRSSQLKYKDVTEFKGNDRITISEPFITPLVEHILYNISGYGVPDYPSSLQTEIKANFKGLFE